MNALFKSPYLFVILSITLCVQASAQLPAGANETATALVGHRKSSESEVRESTDIVVATFKTLGSEGGGDATGSISFSQAQIAIVSTLKGKLSGTANVSYSISTLGENREAVPAIGVRYIMFIQKIEFLGGVLHLDKLELATDQAVAAVKTLIEANKGH